MGAFGFSFPRLSIRTDRQIDESACGNSGMTCMLIESHQDCAMTPDTHASLSGDPSDAAAFLQAFAAAPDWQDCADALWTTLPQMLPGIRMDIYAVGPV